MKVVTPPILGWCGHSWKFPFPIKALHMRVRVRKLLIFFLDYATVVPTIGQRPMTAYAASWTGAALIGHSALGQSTCSVTGAGRSECQTETRSRANALARPGSIEPACQAVRRAGGPPRLRRQPSWLWSARCLPPSRWLLLPVQACWARRSHNALHLRLPLIAPLPNGPRGSFSPV